MFDPEKVRKELAQKHMDESKPDEGLDDFIDAAIEYAKSMPIDQKLEYAKSNPKALTDALFEVSDNDKVKDLLTEMIFIELA